MKLRFAFGIWLSVSGAGVVIRGCQDYDIDWELVGSGVLMLAVAACMMMSADWWRALRHGGQGRLLAAAAAVCWLSAVIAVAASSKVTMRGGPAVCYAVGLGLIATGARFYAMARQHGAVTAFARLDANVPFVFYLRSFAMEDVLAPERFLGQANMLAAGFWDRRPIRFEEMLCEGLAALAPVVALGREGEELPPLGAARTYASGDAWRSEFARLAQEASLVCALTGHSRGLLWELRHMVEAHSPLKLMLVVPPGISSDNWTRFCQSVSDVLPHPLPRTLPKNPLAVRFDSKWTPHLFEGRVSTKAYAAIATAHQS